MYFFNYGTTTPLTQEQTILMIIQFLLIGTSALVWYFYDKNRYINKIRDKLFIVLFVITIIVNIIFLGFVMLKTGEQTEDSTNTIQNIEVNNNL